MEYQFLSYLYVNFTNLNCFYILLRSFYRFFFVYLNFFFFLHQIQLRYVFVLYFNKTKKHFFLMRAIIIDFWHRSNHVINKSVNYFYFFKIRLLWYSFCEKKIIMMAVKTFLLIAMWLRCVFQSYKCLFYILKFFNYIFFKNDPLKALQTKMGVINKHAS